MNVKRFLAVSVLAVLALVFATPSHAVEWATKEWHWNEATTDTVFVTDEADTQRTVTLNTGDWDWPELSHQATAAIPVAFVTFTAQVGNAVSDTLRYLVETCDTPVGSTEVWSYFVGGSLAATDALGNVAVLQGSISTTSSLAFKGALVIDPDASGGPSPTNIYGAGKIRLRVIGDQSGTTPKLSGVKCSIRYRVKRH
jgi:hypothetical protein